MFRNPTTDLLVVLLIVLLIFGPKRLPGLGKQLGHGIREFKDSITGHDNDTDEADRPAIAQSATPPPTTAAPPRAAAGAPAPSSAPPTATNVPPADAASDRDSTEVGSERRS